MYINTTHKQYQVSLDGDETVAALKERIEQEYGVPEQYQKLRFNKKVMHNTRMLSSYGIDLQNSQVCILTHSININHNN